MTHLHPLHHPDHEKILAALQQATKIDSTDPGAAIQLSPRQLIAICTAYLWAVGEAHKLEIALEVHSLRASLSQQGLVIDLNTASLLGGDDPVFKDQCPAQGVHHRPSQGTIEAWYG